MRGWERGFRSALTAAAALVLGPSNVVFVLNLLIASFRDFLLVGLLFKGTRLPVVAVLS